MNAYPVDATFSTSCELFVVARDSTASEVKAGLTRLGLHLPGVPNHLSLFTLAASEDQN